MFIIHSAETLFFFQKSEFIAILTLVSAPRINQEMTQAGK
jgi:hypothetical protein